MSVHCIPDGRWLCKYKDAGKPKKEYFGRGEEGERKALARNNELGLGSAKKGATLLFGELAYEYMQARKNTMTETTYRVVSNLVDSILIPYFGSVQADKITSKTIDSFVSARKGEKVKNRTIRDNINYVHTILNFAQKEGKVLFNPIRGYLLPRDDSERIRPPTAEEFAAILAVAAPHVRRALQLAYFTGTRPGKIELFRLQWKDVDLISRTITITSAQKNGLPLREVPISGSFFPIVAEWHQEDLETRQRYLIHYQGQRVNRIHSGWDNAKRRAGITRRLRMYDIRHMFASVLLARGAVLKTVSKLLGHKNIMQTVTTYQHVADEMTREAIEKL